MATHYQEREKEAKDKVVGIPLSHIPENNGLYPLKSGEILFLGTCVWGNLVLGTCVWGICFW